MPTNPRQTSRHLAQLFATALLALAACSAPPPPRAEAPSEPATDRPLAPAPVPPQPPTQDSQAPSVPGAGQPTVNAAPEAPPTGAPPSWWLNAPTREAGRVRVAARADADTLIEARRGAVEAGTGALRAEAGPQPPDIQTDKTDVARLPDGRWRAFVLMSCKE
jgi:hypothetical protein